MSILQTRKLRCMQENGPRSHFSEWKLFTTVQPHVPESSGTMTNAAKCWPGVDFAQSGDGCQCWQSRKSSLYLLLSLETFLETWDSGRWTEGAGAPPPALLSAALPCFFFTNVPILLASTRTAWLLAKLLEGKVKWKSLSRVPLFSTPWTIRSMGFSRPEYFSRGCHALLQGTFPIQGSNPDLPHCRRIPYQRSPQGNPVVEGELYY